MIDTKKRVYVYFNLHKKVWSVRQSGRVVEHTKNIMLKDCRFLVSEAGRKRVLREKKKNVHAGVSGYVVDSIPEYKVYSEAKITYNPYKHKTFVRKDTGEPIHKAKIVVFGCGERAREVRAIL